MKSICTSLLFLLILNCTTCLAQSPEKKQQIAKAVTDYFHLERENIHVHLNKNIFLTGESIWFKGYVYHRKAGTPFFATTNVYANLIDSQGTILETQLLYGSIGSFSGAFKLNDKMKSGKYFLQFYTNWMNNFTEDESAVYEVAVIDPETGATGVLGKADLSTVRISFYPEGGTFLKDVNNAVGIRISDCLNKPIAASSVNIVNAAGTIVKTIQVNKMGYGRFDLPSNEQAGLRAVINLDGLTHEQPLPPAVPKGFALEINNYSFPDKLIAKVRTNTFTLNSYSGKAFYLLLQQDDKVLIHEFHFTAGKLEQTIVIPQADLPEGTNTIRILDSELNQLADRLIFKYPATTSAIELQQAKKGADYTEFTGKVRERAMNLSVSILPDATLSLIPDNDIYGSLLIAPYITSSDKISGKYFFESLSKIKHYELDLLMLTHTPKYKWRDILQNPPGNTHTFDMGIGLKATINNKLANTKNHKVRVLSTAGMFDEQIAINDRGEILLENVVLSDSATVQFSLLENGVQKEIKLYPQVINNKRKFHKSYKPVPSQCSLLQDERYGSYKDMFPTLSKNTIVLDAIEIEATKKELKHRKAPGNSQLRPYKITETESRSFFYLLDFIRYHGFTVENNGVSVGIFGRTINTINGQRTTPMIYIDNMQILSPDQLQGVMTEDVDEFYINPHAVVPSVNNRMGIIKIYMKKNFGKRTGGGISDFNYTIKDAFEPEVTFENAPYGSTSDSGFINFGVIDWQPVVLPDASREFTLKIPATSQKSIKVLIEGLSVDGKLISEIKTIQLQ